MGHMVYTEFNYLRMPLSSQDPNSTLVRPFYQAFKATTELLRATVSQRAGRISADEKKSRVGYRHMRTELLLFAVISFGLYVPYQCVTGVKILAVIKRVCYETESGEQIG